jgi:oligopeptide/dipeptide ABC transporter ATP-binding protein
MSAILSVRDLRVEFPTDDGIVTAVGGVTFDLFENEVLGIVGESGSGKTVASLAVLGLLPSSARVSGQVLYRDTDLLAADAEDVRKLRGSKIAMIFQDALTALNPVYRVGDQIAEAIRVHAPSMPANEVDARVRELLELVGIPNPDRRADQYPHEFSGGMRQRAMIAMAIANDPDVLIADEPTTALDVTIQAQVLEVLERIQVRTHSTIVLITHDLGVVAGTADRVLVMYAGRATEIGAVEDIFYNTRHPYTLGLLSSLPRLDERERGLPLYRIRGQPPSLIHVPPGCPFHPRCAFARTPEPCATEVPQLRMMDAPGHRAACHFAEELRDVRPETLRTASR